MKKRLISLRTAILAPFILVVFLILGIFMVLWTADYNWLVTEQGTKILSSMITNTNQELNAMLSEPLRINELYASTITSNKLYGKASVSEIESLSVEFMKKLAPNMGQISVISYGDENKNFVGIRSNTTAKSFSLMVSDTRTDGILNIYENETISSKILASYEGYDPRTRPWYAPVKINPLPMWSDIYVNMDEKMESTISSLFPVFDSNNNFQGVCDIDIKLDGINQYLKSAKTKGSGVIYIIDKNWKIIAHSGTEEVTKIIPGATPTAELMAAVESPNSLIKSSAQYLINNKIDLGKIVKLKTAGSNQFALISRMEQPSDLNWRIVVIVPENDLMGAVKERQNAILLFTIILGLSGILVGAYILSRVISPILKSADAAKSLADGKWDVQIEKSTSNIYETDLLVQGFNTMSEKIRLSFNELLAAQSEIERLHEAEKTSLETIVTEKTDELKLAMKELSEKEKLASLGSLVTGIAHEINTPLGVAVSAGSLMENLLNASQEKITAGHMTKSDFVHYMETMEESVTIINSNLLRAATLVKSFKQIAVNQSMEEKTTFNMAEYLDTILISLKHVLKQKKRKTSVICNDTLEIFSYPGAFSQILTNLIMNSLTHGFGENDEGEITIEIKEKEQHIILLYSDNGKGIEPNVLPKVFDPFFTTNRSKGGSGLGLNIVYNIVTSQLNGKISCTSNPGNGTTFKIEIPV